MNKLISLLVLTSLSFTPALAIAQGGFSGTNNATAGGYTGPSTGQVKISEVTNFRDDTPVYLEGKIVSSLGNERYEFTDGSGTIIVDIDNEDWMGLSVGPKDKVGVWGEVDKDWNSIEIDVDRITKL